MTNWRKMFSVVSGIRINIGMMETSVGPGEHIVFHADHPFLYLITESSTGAVLFAGRYCGK